MTIFNHSRRIRPIPAEFLKFCPLKNMEISAVFVVLGIKRFCRKLHLKYVLITTYICLLYGKFVLVTICSVPRAGILNYDIGNVIFDISVMDRKRQAVIIAAYGLCHPDWSHGCIIEQVWKAHNTKVLLICAGHF